MDFLLYIAIATRSFAAKYADTLASADCEERERAVSSIVPCAFKIASEYPKEAADLVEDLPPPPALPLLDAAVH